MHSQLPLYIDGELTPSQSTRTIPVNNPATQLVLTDAPCATKDEIEHAIASAKKAFQSWKETPSPERARLMLRYQQLLKDHHDELLRF